MFRQSGAIAMNKNRQQLLKKAAQTHQQNVQRYLQRRIEAARARGDEKLVKILEAEANYQK
jgi:hypothetical protein